MIIHRLTIRNYRGVDEASVEFAPVGITLIEGANEVGKTSLIEAMRNIFEYPDNSKHRSIMAIKPTHRDEGPEVVLEAEAGPYHFTYFKRFHKKPATELTVTAPVAENHTGRQAHERAEEILNETIDRVLWKAVGVQQGEGISQAELRNAGSLTAALDRAAGGEAISEEEISLLELVEKEFLKYYTPGGREGKEIEPARRAEEELESSLSELQLKALEFETDAERAFSVKEEIGKFNETINGLKKEAEDARENLVKVNKLEGEIKTLELELGNLQRDSEAAQKDLEGRKKLIKQIGEREKEIEELTSSLMGTSEKLEKSEESVTSSQRSREDASKSHKELRAARDLRQKDFEYYRDCHDLKLMEERKTRIDEARARAKGAGAVLEKIRIGEDDLEEILAAERECDSAKARLQVGAPSLVIKSLQAVDIEVDGQKLKLESGAEEVRTVTDEMSVVVPDILEVRVAPGTSSEGLGRQLEMAEGELAGLLEKCGVKGSADARKNIQARNEAESQVQEVRKVEEENLRDLTFDELLGRSEGLREVTATYIEDRIENPPMAEDLDSARKAQQEAENALKEAEQYYENADNVCREAENARNDVKGLFIEAESRIAGIRKYLGEMTTDLEKARDSASESDLEQKLSKAGSAAGEKQGIIGLKKEELSELNPDQVRALAETSEGSHKSASERLRNLELEQAGLESRLRALGEEGLHEKVQKVKGDLFRRRRDNRSLFRRASAAHLLYTTMKEEQGKAHEKYKAPFKDRIEQLGRMIYGDSFQVVLNDNLSIESRSLGSRTVPFDSLSGGAMEQLAIIARIAAAMLVSEDKPVPIIIDDALGYTDPGRLKLMGAALAQLGKTGQVIVLTCTPERYAHLGKVEVVPMRSTTAGDN